LKRLNSEDEICEAGRPVNLEENHAREMVRHKKDLQLCLNEKSEDPERKEYPVARLKQPFELERLAFAYSKDQHNTRTENLSVPSVRAKRVQQKHGPQAFSK
jgi:hypothetical protein